MITIIYDLTRQVSTNLAHKIWPKNNFRMPLGIWKVNSVKLFTNSHIFSNNLRHTGVQVNP
jgi:hypothetical protein